MGSRHHRCETPGAIAVIGHRKLPAVQSKSASPSHGRDREASPTRKGASGDGPLVRRTTYLDSKEPPKRTFDHIDVVQERKKAQMRVHKTLQEKRLHEASVAAQSERAAKIARQDMEAEKAVWLCCVDLCNLEVALSLTGDTHARRTESTRESAAAIANLCPQPVAPVSGGKAMGASFVAGLNKRRPRVTILVWNSNNTMKKR